MVDTDAGVLLIGEEAKTVRKGEGEWQGVVIYRSVRSRPRRLYSEEVRFAVEPRRRKPLSVTHMAAHLAALALNAASVPFWTKDFAELDGFGRPNLDKAAIENSSIEPAISTDLTGAPPRLAFGPKASSFPAIPCRPHRRRQGNDRSKRERSNWI